MAPLDSYLFFNLWYLSCDVVVNKITPVGDALDRDCSQQTVYIDVKRKKSGMYQRVWVAFSSCLFPLTEGGVYRVFCFALRCLDWGSL